MNDPLVLVLAALSAVTTGLTFLFRLLMTEKDKSFARLERDSEARAQDMRDDNQWLREKVTVSLDNQIKALDLISVSIRQQGDADHITGESVREILRLLQASVDPHTGSGR